MLMLLSNSLSASQDLFRRITDVGLLLNSTLDIDQLLTYIIETAADMLGCEAASLLLFNEDTGELRFVAATGSDAEKLAAIPVPLEGSIAGRIFTEGETIIEQDVNQTKDHYKKVGDEVKFVTRSLLGVSLSIEGKRIGVLEALNKRSGWFDEEDEVILSAIAVQAALALRNARQMKKVQDAYNQLSSFETFRSAFMAIASHELRTPLAIVTQILDLLQFELGEDFSSLASDAVGAADRMREVIDTMTQLELLRSGQMQYQAKQLAVQPVIEEVLRDLHTAARKKGHQVYSAFLDRDLYVQSDRDRLYRVCANLLKNAIAFTPENGTIALTVEATEDSVSILVTDDGIGLAEPELDRVFDEYYQVEHYLTRSQDGLGLGLTIARRLMQLDKGTLRLTSEGLNKGVTAHVQYPLAA